MVYRYRNTIDSNHFLREFSIILVRGLTADTECGFGVTTLMLANLPESILLYNLYITSIDARINIKYK